MTAETLEQLNVFKARLADVSWLRHAGEPDSTGIVVGEFAEAIDTWGGATVTIWGARTLELEAKAQNSLGDDVIDFVFDDISNAVQNDLYGGVVQYLDRQTQLDASFDETGMNAGLTIEVLNQIKRDLAWAAIEFLLREPGFFTSLLSWYERGRWPCSWSGAYPQGRMVLL